MRNLLGLMLLVLVACPGPVPVTPTPDASDASTDTYTACCASMHDVTTECQSTLRHIVDTHLTVLPEACKACGLACR